MEIAAFEHVCGDDGHGNTLQHTATYCNTLQHIATCAEMTDTVVALHTCVEQGVAVCCSVLQCVAVLVGKIVEHAGWGFVNGI